MARSRSWPWYGVSEVAEEARGRLYADKFGLSVVCLRIGSSEDEPSERRHRSTWPSPRDGLGIVRTAPHRCGRELQDRLTVYAVSADTRRFWDTDAGAELGCTPVDDAETFAARLPAGQDPAGTDPQGGEYADAERTLRHR
ncbi:hypothetical protein [Streptomyces sp. NPDC058330]|uniref:hypothetical protein n=1 Tax=Streptomyces sp. NPDC058330 TaxID=3346449 RepID=UPI0036E85CD8